MANHDVGEMSTDFDDEKDCTLCLAHKDFELGQEFTIFYGIRANIDLLVHNGFVFEANEDDCFTLKLGISKNDPLATDKTNFLEELNISRTGLFFIGKLPEKPIDQALIGFLRVLCLNQDDVNYFKEHIDEVKNLVNPEDSSTHQELDKRVYKYLETMIFTKSFFSS